MPIGIVTASEALVADASITTVMGFVARSGLVAPNTWPGAAAVVEPPPGASVKDSTETDDSEVITADTLKKNN